MTRRQVFEMVLGFGAFGLGARQGVAEERVAGRPARAFEVSMTEAEWQRRLTPAQFTVLRKHGTERAGSSPLDKEYGRGTYHCAGCELPLFSSDTKFDSRTGWPSFWAPLPEAVGTATDRSLLMTRTEVHCRRCGGHLGHAFKDGPKPTGLRYCMNGVALVFRRA
ncbi:MAG TPA: peptide-methionine (R)-S-oxide reductase MsrB [Methylomirabilota bacterium]|nr:peptide-methionine (R)-S-oxide reductase MsrB [Methylomirabilota bacterium]